jgi:sulfoxide reductase heme-binding subunit YedZ
MSDDTYRPKRPRPAIVHWTFWIVGLLPLATLIGRFAFDALGANPVEEITHETGEWTLRLLVLTLAVTPLRRWAGWSWLAPERRTLGLLAFCYGSLHFSTYLALDLRFDFAALTEDILERPYITLGFAAFVGMIPLALTSTHAAIKRLGRRWITLHRLVYAVAIGGVVHFAWQVKADLLEPIVYGTIVGALLATRLPWLSRRPVR